MVDAAVEDDDVLERREHLKAQVAAMKTVLEEIAALRASAPGISDSSSSSVEPGS